MSCSMVKLPGGGVAIVKHAAPRRKRCSCCPAWSGFLCDYPVARGGRSGQTCDKPLCGTHAIAQRPDRHYCPEHHAVADF